MTWRKTALGELFTVGSSRRVVQSQWKNEGVPFYRGREISLLAMEGFVNNELFISEELYAGLSLKSGVPNSGDIMITAIGTIGNSYIVKKDDKFYFKDASVLWLKKSSPVSSEFVNWWLRSPLFFDQLDSGKGATVDTLTIQKLKNVLLGLPPLPEQHRIVAILDAAFNHIATAKANCEANLLNARAIFESQLQKVFAEPKDAYTETNLGDVCTFVGGSQPPKSVFTKSASENSIRLIQIRDYKSNANLVYVPRPLAKRFCNVQDVMIGRYGPPLFQILRGLEGAYNVALMKAVPQASKLTHDFLYCFLRHPAILKYVVFHSARAAGRIGLTKDTLEPYPIFLPLLPEQKRITKAIAEIEIETKHLESIYKHKLQVLDDLKKTLLHQAFSGAL